MTSPGDNATPRLDFRQWLSEQWDPSLTLLEWRERLVDAGWARPSWAADSYGRGLPSWTEGMVNEELTSHGAVGLAPGVGSTLAAPTLLEHAAGVLRDALLRPTLTGAATWCQLFSEPGAGSDLAGLTARAELDGDRWVVNGQKLWSTSAAHADFGLLLARTDPGASKHRGITCFALPMPQDGIDVRPIRQMNGHASFNEVFLTDVEVPADHVIGAVNGGWSVALSALQHERRFGGLGRPPIPDGDGELLAEARHEAAEHLRTYEWYPQRQGRPDLLCRALAEAHRAQDPRARGRVIEVLTLQRVSEWTAERLSEDSIDSPIRAVATSLGKLATSEIARRSAAVHAELAGPYGMLTEGPGRTPVVAEIITSFPAQSIAGGTDNIQKNIVAERGLGLPR